MSKAPGHSRRGARVKLPKTARVRSFGDGPLVRKVYREWSRQLIEELASPKPAPDARKHEQFILRWLKMKPETLIELQAEIEQIESEFLERAVREMSIHREGLLPVRWISAMDVGSFVRRL